MSEYNNNFNYFNKAIPYKYIKLYKSIKITKSGSVILEDKINFNNKNDEKLFIKVFFNEYNKIVFIESYDNNSLLDYELKIINNKIYKKILFNEKGNKKFYITYNYKNNRLIKENAFNMMNNILYTNFFNKKGSIYKTIIYKL